MRSVERTLQWSDSTFVEKLKCQARLERKGDIYAFGMEKKRSDSLGNKQFWGNILYSNALQFIPEI